MPKLQAGRAVKLLLHKFAGRVRLAYRHFPLEGVHPHALHGALAAEPPGRSLAAPGRSRLSCPARFRK
jgi:hypothetical protein